jgi:UDP-xylose/UDP-N-acetylglucosamine transporter B4
MVVRTAAEHEPTYRSVFVDLVVEQVVTLQAGSALTFSQTLFITVQTLPQFLTWPAPRHTWFPRLKPRAVPLRRWVLQVLVHTTGSLLNNWAFAFHVPLTVQIVFRSAGALLHVSLIRV